MLFFKFPTVQFSSWVVSFNKAFAVFLKQLWIRYSITIARHSESICRKEKRDKEEVEMTKIPAKNKVRLFAHSWDPSILSACVCKSLLKNQCTAKMSKNVMIEKVSIDVRTIFLCTCRIPCSASKNYFIFSSLILLSLLLLYTF